MVSKASTCSSAITIKGQTEKMNKNNIIKLSGWIGLTISLTIAIFAIYYNCCYRAKNPDIAFFNEYWTLLLVAIAGITLFNKANNTL